eukprot:7519200-Pyramimonas_sp.AAC.1
MGGRKRRPPRPRTRKPCKTHKENEPRSPHGGSRQLFSGPGPAMRMPVYLSVCPSVCTQDWHRNPKFETTGCKR